MPEEESTVKTGSPIPEDHIREDLRKCPYCGGRNHLPIEGQDGMRCQCGATCQCEEWSDELKENNCEVKFICLGIQKCCVYSSPGQSGECKYKKSVVWCTSKVAQANAMTIKLKELTGGES
jgi:hypothetical protein